MPQNPTALPRDPELERALLIMRLAIAAFLAVWALDKIVGPGAAMATFSTYYAAIDSQTVIMGLGLAQLALIAAFVTGLQKTLTYGAVMTMHAASTVASWPRYIDPLARPNILFWAAVPVLAAMIALFILRRRDRLWTIETGLQG